MKMTLYIQHITFLTFVTSIFLHPILCPDRKLVDKGGTRTECLKVGYFTTHVYMDYLIPPASY